MITLSGTNAVHDVGELTVDLSVSGTNSTVRGTIPDGRAIKITVSGTNLSLFLSGEGSITLSLSGKNCMAVVAPRINATIRRSGINNKMKREPISADQKPGQGSETTVTGTNVSVGTVSQVDVESQSGDLAEKIADSVDVDDAGTGTADSAGATDYETGIEASNTKIYQKCSNCGTTLSDYDNPPFCPECGIKTGTAGNSDTEIYDP